MNNKSLENSAKKRKTTLNVLSYILLGFWALMVIFPFYWMIITSFKTSSEYNGESLPHFVPLDPTIENYISAFTTVDLGRYLLNTVIFAVITTLIMLIVTIPSAYAFARLKFKGKDLLFGFFLSLMMIPNELVVITNFQTITNMNLRNSFAGLILPSVASVFFIYLLKENFEAVPDEIYKAAKIDGTSDFKFLLKVMIPMNKPTIVTIIILKVIECWNSFVWPRLITDLPKYYLVSNGIQAIRESGFGRENTPGMMAAVVIVSIPLIILFLVFRKKIMEGVSRGGTKG